MLCNARPRPWRSSCVLISLLGSPSDCLRPSGDGGQEFRVRSLDCVLGVVRRFAGLNGDSGELSFDEEVLPVSVRAELEISESGVNGIGSARGALPESAFGNAADDCEGDASFGDRCGAVDWGLIRELRGVVGLGWPPSAHHLPADAARCAPCRALAPAGRQIPRLNY